MSTLSAAVIAHKNVIASTNPILIALELSIPSLDDPIYIVRNNENVTWRGITWQGFPFEIDDIEENSTGEVSSINITVANASAAMGIYIKQYDAWIKENVYEPIIATIHVISTSDLDNTDAILSIAFDVGYYTITATQVVFNLTQENIYTKKFPPHAITRRCRFKFGSEECGVVATIGQTCAKTLSACRAYENSVRFGGYPSVGGDLDKVWTS